MPILLRYISGEVLRSFLLALVTMTAIFVLFMVAAEAMRSKLLEPQDIARLVPFIVPSTLPYTIPVSLLFSVTVVYGRIAGDNEIIAVKAAGLSVMKVIWPTILLATGLSVLLLYLGRTWIPASAHHAKQVIFKDVEDTFYKVLKRDREFNGGWPFLIKVSDVEDRVMIDAIFKKRARNPDGSETFSATIWAKRARLHFDFDRKVVVVHFEEDAELQNYGRDGDVALLNSKTLEIPIPEERQFTLEKSIQECTNQDLDEQIASAEEKIGTERKRQAITTGLKFAMGRFEDVNWGTVQKSFIDYNHYQRKIHEYQTEKQLRTSMAFGSLLFVILGAPVGILFAKRDFLSAFISCFMPIILLYYPLTLFGVNLGKEGTLPPAQALWMGNLVLAALSIWAYPRVIKY
jgi:lipopolysaccharide export system permease protein